MEVFEMFETVQLNEVVADFFTGDLIHVPTGIVIGKVYVQEVKVNEQAD